MNPPGPQAGPSHPTLPNQRRSSILNRLISVATFRATLWVWLAFAILLLSFLFHIIAFSIVEWGHILEPRKVDLGLWQMCQDNGCTYYSVSGISDAYRCTQAFATLSFLMMFSSLLLTTVYIFYEELQTDGLTHMILLAVRGATVLFLMITFAVWSDHWLAPFDLAKGATLGAGFALEVVCFVFEIVATGLLVADYLLNIRRKP